MRDPGRLATQPISRRELLCRAAGLGLSLGGLGPLEKELHLYNWSDYIADETVPDFEREFGVRVTYDTYESREES